MSPIGDGGCGGESGEDGDGASGGDEVSAGGEVSAGEFCGLSDFPQAKTEKAMASVSRIAIVLFIVAYPPFILRV
jgi:hypothetical protein